MAKLITKKQLDNITADQYALADPYLAVTTENTTTNQGVAITKQTFAATATAGKNDVAVPTTLAPMPWSEARQVLVSAAKKLFAMKVCGGSPLQVMIREFDEAACERLIAYGCRNRDGRAYNIWVTIETVAGSEPAKLLEEALRTTSVGEALNYVNSHFGHLFTATAIDYING